MKATSKAIRDMTISCNLRDHDYCITVKVGRDQLCAFKISEKIWDDALTKEGSHNGRFYGTRLAHCWLVGNAMEETAPLTHRLAGEVFKTIEKVRIENEIRKTI